MLAAPAGALASAFGGCGASGVPSAFTAAGGSFAVSASSGVVSSSVTTGSGGAFGKLATSCNGDADCGGGLLCLTAGTSDPIFGGGAPNGFCTKACAADWDCGSLGGVCYKIDPTQPGRCTLPCMLAQLPQDDVSGLFTKLSPDKCRGRSDVRCARLGATMNGVCLPTCGDDAQCDGRYCDPRTVVCVDVPSTGLPIGAACDPTADASVCAGLCVGFQTGAAICSDPCVLGADPDGGPLPYDCGGADRGLCAFHPMQNGAGDMGYCTPACTTQGECQNPSFWCFSVPELSPATSKGYCFAAAPCPKGQVDCNPILDGGTSDGGWDNDGGISDGGPADAPVADGSYTCTATPLGAFCLDPRYPLALPDAGDSGPEDAGPSDGGADG
jgi:hypothetical protein